MNFKFLLNEAVNEAAKRVAIELLDDSIIRLKNVESKFDESIHETRKNFKKMRALLRMIRLELGSDLYKSENLLFRDTGRILSGIRDASVMVESADFIKQKHLQEIQKNDYALLRKNLSLRARRIRAQFKKNKELIDAIVNILSKHKDNIRKWPLRKKTIGQVFHGVKIIYEQGQSAMSAARKNPSADNFHEWRKRTKYLMYQVKILEDCWPEYLNLLSLKLSNLSETLGMEHDLSELRNLLLREPTLFANKEAQTKLFNLIGQERLILQSKSKAIAPYIYSESSDNFTCRLQAYWEQAIK